MRFSLFLFGATYLAFQKKLLPQQLSRYAARFYFWPTLPFTFALRRGALMTRMDETVLVGVAPIAFSVAPKELHTIGVRGIINLCDEFKGPSKTYDELGLEELWIPTIDHFEPSLSNLWIAVKFISKFKKLGQQVYVHCKAGHGRSAAVIFCWLVTQTPNLSSETIANNMMKKRKIRKNLHLQQNTRLFRDEYLELLKDQKINGK